MPDAGPAIVVSGAIANKLGSGGEAWVRLSWLLGLQRLGCRVNFVEQIAPSVCVGADGSPAPFLESVNLRYFQDIMDGFGVDGQAALVLEDESATSGPSMEELEELASGADLLVNISGHLRLDRLVNRFRRKAYVDLDPGFTQYWHASGDAGAGLAGHDSFFTVGANIGTAACRIPTTGIDWHAVRPPVLLDEWAPSNPQDKGRFTTIATWRSGYGPVHFEGESFGLKVHEFRKVLQLPERVPDRLEATFELALDIHPGDARDLEALERHGWRIVDPAPAAGDPGRFRAYLSASGAEFSVAQGIYIETRSGWFSDRTAHYLASGKPALVQDTGLGESFPVGEGLLTFADLEAAVAGAERILGDYPAHSKAARQIAEAELGSDQVLARFLEQAGVA
jgi:hypothetical protein